MTKLHCEVQGNLQEHMRLWMVDIFYPVVKLKNSLRTLDLTYLLKIQRAINLDQDS